MQSKQLFIQQINEMYPQPLLNDDDIATILGIHKESVYRMRKKNRGPAFFKVGKKALCLKEDFFTWFFLHYSQNDESDKVGKT